MTQITGDFRVYGFPRWTGLHHLWNDPLSSPRGGKKIRPQKGFVTTETRMFSSYSSTQLGFTKGRLVLSVAWLPWMLPV